jgi:uncharacterized RDD family membrane protein YckC
VRGATPPAPQTSAPPVPAPLGRRFLSLVYEALLATALLWCAALVFGVAEGTLGAEHVRVFFQIYLAAVAGIYFVWQWAHGGQTLAMKTWGIQLRCADGSPLTTRVASTRYLLALCGTAALGVSYLWAFFDRDRQFLHDRLSRTRIVRC